MNFDERQAAIGTLLRETILPRYRRPDHLDDATARAELSDMVSDLNAEWPIMPANQFAATGQGLARALRASYSGRSWPPIAVMLKALRASLEPPAAPREGVSASKVDIGEIRKAQLLRWCRGEGPCADSLITRGNLEALAAEGLILRSEVQPMLDFAARNHGISAEADSLRRSGNLPASLMREDTDAGIRAEIDAMGDRLRGTGIRNPAFAGAAE